MLKQLITGILVNQIYRGSNEMESIINHNAPVINFSDYAALKKFSINCNDWVDWKWQQRNSVTSISMLKNTFPEMSSEMISKYTDNLQSRKLGITPHLIKEIKNLQKETNISLETNPLWRQFVPCWQKSDKLTEYNGQTENWELPEEMKTPICQHKYDNRVIIRLSNSCFGYCQFCYEALRTLEKDTGKSSFKQSFWLETLKYIDSTPEVDEVILSGGEPLMHSDKHLKKVLTDLSSLSRPLLIRVHTRVLSFNPYRITPSLLNLFKQFPIHSIGIHVASPAEITTEFLESIMLLRQYIPIIFANIPLINGVNADIGTMKKLCLLLYKNGIIPHYLYHFMPFSPGVSDFQVSIENGVKLMKKLKRHISNIAVPEYVLPHYTGKYTVPLDVLTEDNVSHWEETKLGRMFVFTNWKNQTVKFPD